MLRFFSSLLGATCRPGGRAGVDNVTFLSHF